MKIATLFSGGGVLDAAIHKAGLNVDLAVECDPERLELSAAIAESYRLNYGDHLIFSPVEEVKFYRYRGDWGLLHASPSCKNFSDAKGIKIESAGDLAAAAGVADAIAALRPLYFTLEQVRGYLSTSCFQVILMTLKDLGYSVSYDVLNSYYYGVPQERNRLILTACRDGSPVGLPSPGRPTGWGEVLEDRLDGLSPSQPTDKQKEAVRRSLELYPDSQLLLVQRWGYRGELPIVRHCWEPSPVLTCSIFTDGKGASRKTFYDIWMDGQWYGLGLREMARLQTIPDWYILPERSLVAGTIIGNGVPTALYSAVLKRILKHYGNRN